MCWFEPGQGHQTLREQKIKMQSVISFHNVFLRYFFFIFTLLICGCSEEDNSSKNNKPTTVENRSANNVSIDASDTDIEEDVLVIGTSADYMPFEFVKDGEVVGFDIDLIKAISEVLQMNMIIRDMQFYSLIPALQNGDINVVISGMFETPDRKREVDFSKTYYRNDFALLTKGDYDPVKPIRTGMVIGVQTGTLMYSWITSQSLDIKIMSMDRTVELVEDLKNGRLDGVLIDDISAREIMKMNPDSNLVSAKLTNVNETGIAIAIKKGSPLLKKINYALEVLEKNGTLQKIKDKWGM